jgi:DNA-binding NarL/FixJ family response regulator
MQEDSRILSNNEDFAPGFIFQVSCSSQLTSVLLNANGSIIYANWSSLIIPPSKKHKQFLKLTGREFAVLQNYILGKTAKDIISNELFLSRNTLKYNSKNIY